MQISLTSCRGLNKSHFRSDEGFEYGIFLWGPEFNGEKFDIRIYNPSHNFVTGFHGTSDGKNLPISRANLADIVSRSGEGDYCVHFNIGDFSDKKRFKLTDENKGKRNDKLDSNGFGPGACGSRPM